MLVFALEGGGKVISGGVVEFSSDILGRPLSINPVVVVVDVLSSLYLTRISLLFSSLIYLVSLVSDIIIPLFCLEKFGSVTYVVSDNRNRLS